MVSRKLSAIWMLLIPVFLTLFTAISGQQNRTTCLKEEFNCLDGFCLADDRMCDGTRDCPSGLDELVCSTSACQLGYFACIRGSARECIEARRVCDGIADCSGRQDEQQCPASSPGDPCMSTEFHCASTGVLGLSTNRSRCVPLRYRCNAIVDCVAGEDETGCSIPRLIRPPEPEVQVSRDGTITLNCVAEGSPTPFILWLKDSQPILTDSRISTASVNGSGVLVIRNASVTDEGIYSCLVEGSFYSFVATNTSNITVISDSFTCRDHNNRQFNEGDRYYLVQSFTSGDARTAAVDVVFVVDESGSIRAQNWIRNITPLLEQRLRDQGVGLGDRQNQFGLVGFARNMPSAQGGIVLTQLTSLDNFINASRNLRIDGSVEDGYSGIEFALNQIQLRPNTARLLVLVTNEDRSILPGREDLTRDIIEQMIRSRGFVFNTVVDQTFQTSSGEPAFGLNSNRTAYQFIPPDQYTTSPNGLRHADPQLTFGNTYEDYVQLAFRLGGAAWDIKSLLAEDSPLLPALSRAFIEENVMEVMEVFRRCFNCLCVNAMGMCVPAFSVPLDDCQGPVPAAMTLSAEVNPRTAFANIGRNFTFECIVTATPPLPLSSLNFTWIKIELPMDRVICSGSDCRGNTLTITDVEEGDQGMYSCRVSAFDRMPAMSMDGTLQVVDAPSIVDPPTSNVNVTTGKPIVVTCSAMGIPTPSISWIRTDGGPVSDNAQVQREGNNSTLIIDPAQQTDGGQYACIAINTFGSDREAFTTEVSVTECQVDGKTLEIGEFSIVFRLDNMTLSADIVLLVDESSSMSMEHMWIRNMARELEETLNNLNIGVGLVNQFGVAGFASSNTGLTLGRVVLPRLVNISEIDSLIDQLMVNGRMEDGYAVIQFASNNYNMDRRARQFILISDENRDVLNSSLSRGSILDLLRRSRTKLNVAVSEQFEAGNLRALGIDDSMNAYIFDPLSPSLLRRRPNGAPFVESAFKTTHEDYTELALMVNSGAWDLSLLRNGGMVAEAFTRAFVMVEVEEIVKQLRECMNCTCTESGLMCIALPSPDEIEECSIQNIVSGLRPAMTPTIRDLQVTIEPRYSSSSTGSSLTLRCETTAGTIAWTFEGGGLSDNVNVTTTGSVSILQISNVMISNRGRYACLARQVDQVNEIETVREGETTSYVEVTPSTLDLGLEVSPDTIVIRSGQTVNLTCSVTEDASFMWIFRNNHTLPANTIVSSSSRQSIITILEANTNNSGIYTCRGMQAGTGLSADRFVIVNVRAPELLLSVSPVELSVEEGTLVRFVCSSNIPGISLRWFQRDREDLPSSAIQTSSVTSSGQTQLTLEISSSTIDDCGQFVCEGRSGELLRMATGNLLVTVAMKVEIAIGENLDDTGSVVLMFDDSEFFVCNSNEQIDSWIWMFNNNAALPEETVSIVLPDNRALLFIRNVTENHRGTFTCIGRLGNRSLSDSVTVDVAIEMEPTTTSVVQASSSSSSSSLTVFPSLSEIPTAAPSPSSLPSPPLSSPSPSITVPSLNVDVNFSPSVVYFDRSVNITCSVNTPAMITWTYKNGSLPTNARPVMVDQQQSVLMIDIFIPTNNGRYMCTADNTIQRLSDYVSLIGRVLVFGTVSVSPGTVSALQSTSAILRCTSNRAVISFIWNYQSATNGPLPAQVTTTNVSSIESELTVTSVSNNNTGTYYCTGVFHPNDEKSTDLAVISLQNPNLIVRINRDSELTIPQGESLDIVCMLDCTCQGARVKWTRNDGMAFPPTVQEAPAVTGRLSTLMITSAQSSTGGSYTCTGTLEGEDPEKVTTRITVTG